LTRRRPSWFLTGHLEIIAKENHTRAEDLRMGRIKLLCKALREANTNEGGQLATAVEISAR